MSLSSKLTGQRLLAILVCASIVTSALGSALAGRVRVLTQWAIAPLGDGGMYVTNAVRTGMGRPRVVTGDEYRRLQQENRILKAYVADMQAELSDLRRQAPEMKRIFGQIPRSQHPYELIPARVVARDSMPYGQTGILAFGIAKGAVPSARVTTRDLRTDLSKDLEKDLSALALPEDRPAVVGCVLVGRLTETWPFGATLQLVTDKGFKVNARIHRIIQDPGKPRTIKIIGPGRARTEPLTSANNEPVPAFAEGGGDALVVRGVSENDSVLPGDILATREDGFLPTPIVIGEVIEVSGDVQSPGRVIVRVKPAADLDRLRFVYIVVPGR